MTWLAFLFALEVGFQSRSELMYLAPDFDTLGAGYQVDSPYVTMEAAGELFDFFQVGGSAKIFMADRNDWQYTPYDARFLFFFKASLYGFTAGFEHECIHPLLADGRTGGFLYGGGDRLFLRFDGKIGGRP